MSQKVVGAGDRRFFEGITAKLRFLYVTISRQGVKPQKYHEIGDSLYIRLDRVDHDECIFTMKSAENDERTFNGDSGIVSADLAMTFAALAVKMATQSELSSIDVRMGENNRYEWTKEVVTFQKVANDKRWEIYEVNDDDYWKTAYQIEEMSHQLLVNMMELLNTNIETGNNELAQQLNQLMKEQHTNHKDDVEIVKEHIYTTLEQLLEEQYKIHKDDVESGHSAILQKLEELTEKQKQQTTRVRAIRDSVSEGKTSVQSLSKQLAHANKLIDGLVEDLAGADGTIDKAFESASNKLNTKNNSEFTYALNTLKTTINATLEKEKENLKETATVRTAASNSAEPCKTRHDPVVTNTHACDGWAGSRW